MDEHILTRAAIIGDIIGSKFEFHAPKNGQSLLSDENYITDDSLFVLATVSGVERGKFEYKPIVKHYSTHDNLFGFSGMTLDWADSNDQYKESYGNGCLPRIAALVSMNKHYLTRDALMETHNSKEALDIAKRYIDLIEHGFTGKKSAPTGYLLDAENTLEQAIVCASKDTLFNVVIRALSLKCDTDTVLAVALTLWVAWGGKIDNAVEKKCYKIAKKDLLCYDYDSRDEMTDEMLRVLDVVFN